MQADTDCANKANEKGGVLTAATEKWRNATLLQKKPCFKTLRVNMTQRYSRWVKNAHF